MKYRMYIDEVGNHDLKSSSNPNERFLSLTGVIIALDYVQSTLHPQMELLKNDIFSQHPDEPVILHRKEIINAKQPFQILRNNKIRSEFDQRLLKLLRTWEYTVITVCLDKKNHLETYETWHYHAYHYCMEMVLERYIFFLDHIKSHGDVMAESRGGKEDIKLKNSFERLCEYGTHYLKKERLDNVLTSRQLKVKPKAINIPGLQLADLIAHPSRNEILKDNNLLNKPLGPFSKLIMDILQLKYYQSDTIVYGKKFQ